MCELGKLVFLSEGLARLSPLAQETAFGEQDDPFPASAAVLALQVLLKEQQLPIPVGLALDADAA